MNFDMMRRFLGETLRLGLFIPKFDVVGKQLQSEVLPLRQVHLCSRLMVLGVRTSFASFMSQYCMGAS